MKRRWCAPIGLLLLAATAAQAQFTHATNDGNITITGYFGTAGAVVIPTTINGRTVTRIGNDAFAVCLSLTNVTIPSSVTSIGNSAFEGTRLAGVTLPGSVTNIGSYAFYACRSLTNVTIPVGVTSIGNDAFAVCTNLTKAAIPGSVTNLGDYAFYACRKLADVTLPGSVTNIGNWVFSECSSLTNVIIPGSATNIEKDAFSYCAKLASVTIPGSVTRLGEDAFHDCASLTSVSFMGNAPAADLTVFGSDTKATVYYLPGTTGWSSTLAGLPTAQVPYIYTTSDGDITITACFGVDGNVTIPASINGQPVTSIAAEAFQGCTNLTSVTIPASVTNIGNNAFSSCTALTSIFFQGNAPAADSTAFGPGLKATVYYLPHTTDWSSNFAGLPAVLLNLLVGIQVLPVTAGAVVTGQGYYAKGLHASVTASTTNDCYEFVRWMQGGRTVSSNSQYTFTVANNEALVACFAQRQYTISTSSSPANWGTTSGGGTRECGTPAAVTARAETGFAFTEWTSSLGVTSTNATFKVPAGSDASFVAHFKDVERPTIKITAPSANETIETSAFAFEGSATDNASVSNVYYNLNQTGWQAASSTNNFKSWSASVTLTPHSTNFLSAYAVDTSGNCSLTNAPIKFICF